MSAPVDAEATTKMNGSEMSITRPQPNGSVPNF